jgi:hypothetical protein
MPTRLLREGILSSERVDQLDWPAEVFYRRLMSKVDDHGLYDARPSILRASLYPLKVDRVREADISRWIAACEKAGVIALYSAGGKPYLKMLDTRWQVRAEPKFPLPPENIREQVLTAVHLDVGVVGVEVVDEVNPDAPSPNGLSAGRKANGHHVLDSSPVVIKVPLVGDADYPVTQSMVTEFEALYPAVDVPQTLREIRGWNLANPARRKTARGVLKHINGWLAKEQNKG